MTPPAPAPPPREWDFSHNANKVTPLMLAVCRLLSDKLVAIAAAAKARIEAADDDDTTTPIEG